MRIEKIVALNESAERRQTRGVKDIPFQLVADYQPTGDQPKEAWISADITRAGGSAADVPVLAEGEALLPADLNANWKVDWSCDSDRCDVKKCSAVRTT